MDQHSNQSQGSSDNEPKDLSPTRSREYSPHTLEHRSLGHQSVSPGVHDEAEGSPVETYNSPRSGSSASHGKNLVSLGIIVNVFPVKTFRCRKQLITLLKL